MRPNTFDRVVRVSSPVLANHPPVLNEMLYARLVTRFGRVRIQNQGVANQEGYEYDTSLGRSKLKIQGFGETYHVNCPFCEDARGRLSINYTYGSSGPDAAGDLRTFLWRCYNEDCQRNQECRKKLADMLVWTTGQDMPMQLQQGTAATQGVLAETELPGRCTHAKYLAATHEMIAYFNSRGILQSTLVDYDVHFCADAPIRSVIGRAIIPLYFESKLVGWQGRYLGDLDWKAAGVQKYFNLPGLSKSLLLYSYDRALAVPNRPYVVVTEGLTSAWAVGPTAVAVLGKTMSRRQCQLILTGWATRPVFVYLDGSAKDEAEKVANMIRETHNAPVIDVRLPEGRDPGNLDRLANLGMLRGAAAQKGVSI